MPSFESACRLVEEAVQNKVCSCAALAIGRGGDLYVKKAWGRLRFPDGPAADEETLYDLASMTKILSTTMVAFHALENGLLTLYDPLGRFLPVPKDKLSITVKHLMTHTSGLTDHIMLQDAVKDPREAVSCILSSPLQGVPGGQVIYSCMGYLLLGRILETVYGKPLDILARELVYAPLGMAHTGYLPKGDNIAATEIDPDTGEPLCGVVHDENARFLGGVAANAGLFSTIGDCAVFASMLACGGKHGGKPYLSPAMMQAALRNYTPGMDQHRGLGFHLGGTEGNFTGDLFPPESFGHTGFTGTSLVVDQKTGLFVVLLTNRVHPTRQQSGHLRLRRTLHNAVYAEYSRAQG